jgi:hypothetical protein
MNMPSRGHFPKVKAPSVEINDGVESPVTTARRDLNGGNRGGHETGPTGDESLSLTPSPSSQEGSKWIMNK